VLIKRLRLHNFVIFDDVELNLEGVSLTTITGSWANDPRRSNGAGKSALLEAIPYALFGTTRSKQKMDIVRHGAKRCDVEIEFSASGRAVKIARQRNSDGTSNAKMWVDGSLAASQVRNVAEAVKEYLGVDSNLFELIYFFRQDDQFGFVKAGPTERKTYLGRVFDLTQVEACHTVAVQRRKVALEAQHRAEGAVETLYETLGALPPRAALESMVLDLYDDLSHWQLRRHSRETYMAGIPEDIEEAKRLRDEYDRDVAGAVEEHKQLEDEFQTNIQRIARMAVDLNTNETALTQQLDALKQSDVDVDMSKPVSQWQEEVDDFETKQYDVMKDVARLDHIISVDRHAAIEVKELAGETCPTCRQVVGVEHCQHIAADRARRIEQNTDSRSSLSIKLAMVRQQLKNAEAGKVEREKAEALLQQRAKVQAGIDALRATVRKLKEDIDSLNERQPKIRERQAVLASVVNASEAVKVRKRINEIIESHSMASSDNTFDEASMSADAAKAEEKLSAYEEIQERITTAEKSASDKKRDYQVCDELVSVFGKNGLQAILIENVVSVIEQFANDILTQMRTAFRLELRTQKEIQTGEQRETLDIVVVNNGSERMFETYSGGEKTLINLALRLSLSRIISSMRGVVMQSLFLDEVLAALDEINREEAIKVVAFLSKSFEQVFVISHTHEVKDIIPGHVLLVRHEDHSEVSVENGRVDPQRAAAEVVG